MKRSPVTPSLFTKDVTETVRFYTDYLRFSKTGSYKDEDGKEIWAEVTHGDGRIWFFSGALAGQPEPIFTGLIYIFVDDVDETAEALHGKVKVLWGPETQDYGLRELGVEDCNGYMLVFAKDA